MKNTAIPNFFVVGAAKAGTTSLYYYLKQHPNIYLSPIKETHYFSTDIAVAEFSETYKKHTFLDLDSYFSEKPYKELALSFVQKKEHYKKLFEECKNEKAIGECSPSYLFSKEAPQNIYNHNPKAKIIISLRNPISRSFSHYLMALRIGQTSLSFKKAFEKDMASTNKGWGKTELFYELSMYSEQITRFVELFPEEQIKFILFEDLVKNTATIIKECHQFLDIKPLDTLEIEKHNAASIPKYKKINHFFVKTGIKNASGKILGEVRKEKIKKLVFDDKKIPKINEEDKAFLLELYKEDILKTQKIINKDLSAWLQN